jgi:predicted GTPase
MAVNPEQYEDFSSLFSELIDPSIGSKEDAETVVEYCEDLLIDEVTEIILESRSPKLYVFGRSGAGKSSLINALANRQVAEVGTFEPTTVSSEAYNILFPDRNAKWEVIDSRGLFESVPADGGISVETVEKLESDLVEHNPDILLHVMTPEQVRAGKDDFNVVEKLDNSIIGGLPPRVMCLNKVDTFLTPGGDWPPEQNTTLQQQITEMLALVTDILPVSDYCEYDEDEPARGRIYNSNEIIGSFPTYLKENPYWNLTTLVELLCDYLPDKAVLQFAQAQRRERIMRRLARKQTIAVANAVNRIPRKLIVNPNVPIVTGFESYLIALIASFSGRELGVDSVDEFIDTRSMSIRSMVSTTSRVAVDTLTGIFKQDVSYIRNNMYCVGRAAEVYFFDDEVVEPEEFMSEAKAYFTGE